MDIQAITDNAYKFYGCKYRSLEEEEVTIKRCSCQGGDYNVKGYACYKRDIFQVTTEICSECMEYEPKK
jgi:hypothetical protein